MPASASPPLAADYDEKPAAYFEQARHDIVAMLPTGPTSAILELGCSEGGTGVAAMAAGKAGRYVGIELHGPAAQRAATRLTQVLEGDVADMDLTPFAGQFDALVLSEVIEHVSDPWATLGRLVACLKPGAKVYASSPNVAHHKIIRKLLRGRFEYEAWGIMDRTHLRWFTPASFRALFDSAGVTVESLVPLSPMRWYIKPIHALTGGRIEHLYIKQMMLVGHKR
jgi:2-polyprenyl-3-methyl-5-hydroxy-6-metoxy-1,4-benzoquinol methylase